MDQMEYGANIMTLVDEEGAEHQFEIVDAMDYKDGSYMALVPVLDDADEFLDDDGELIVLKVVEEDGEEFLEPIDDEDEFNEVAQIFMKKLEEFYDFTDDEPAS